MAKTPEWRAVQHWSRKAREATAKRDKAIVAMRASGATLRDIAEAAELTHPGVIRILERQDRRQ